MRQLIRNSVVGLLTCALWTGCQCAAPPTKQVALSVSIDPAAVTLNPGVTQRFTATVLPGNGNSVVWTVEEENGGTITAEGEYTAPAVLGAFHVRATSPEDANAFARATVTILPAGVAISITPSAVTLASGQTQQFAAAVAGTTQTAVTWLVAPSSGGTVSETGLYTAASAAGTYSVIASLVADPSVKATATVTVTGAPRVSITPSTVTVGEGQTQQFTATVAGIADQNVTWSVASNGGTVTGGGLYTAPTAPGVYTVTATSQSAPTATATATVTVVPITVSVSPGTALVEVGSSQQYTAVVSGLSSMQVTWSVQQGNSCGIISTTGVYSPPSTVGTCTIVATTPSGHTGTAVATVINPVTVQLTPQTVTMRMTQTQQFSVVVSGSANQAVTWSIREGSTGGTISSTGLYTAPTVTASSVFHVVATAQANPARSAEAVITVQPGIGVSISPTLVTVVPGATQTFTATVTGSSNTAVTWAVQEGAGGGVINAAGVYTAPSGSGTYHVVASSVADPSQKGFASVVVLGSPVDVTGTVTYPGTHTGTVYVILAADNTGAGIVGTSTRMVNGTATFSLRGVRQRGDLVVRAFMDTAATGMYHPTADPFGTLSVTVGDTGLSGLTVALEDADWNGLISLATPSLERVIPGDEAALVAWKPALDLLGREDCPAYRLYWSNTVNAGWNNNIGSMLVPPDAPRFVVIRGLTNGQQLYFTMTCPDALLGGRAAEVGPITIGTPSGGFTLSGVVNSPVLGGTAPLYVVAVPRVGAGGFMSRVSSPVGIQNWSMPGVAAGTYEVVAFRDVLGDGRLTPADVGTFASPGRVVVSGNTVLDPITISGANAVARVHTGHLDDGGTHSYSLYFRVHPNLKRPVKATVIAGAKIAVPYDLPLNDTGGARHEVLINLTTTAPEANDSYSIAVTYSDGTSETLTATVSALLQSPMVIGPATITSGTPTFQWNVLSPAPASKYLLSLKVYDWTYPVLKTAAPLKAEREDIASTTTLLLYSEVNPADLQLSPSILPYWWYLRAIDEDGNWSQTTTSFIVQ